MHPEVDLCIKLQAKFFSLWNRKEWKEAQDIAKLELSKARIPDLMGHPSLLLRALLDNGLACMALGDLDSARKWEEEAQALTRELEALARRTPDDRRGADFLLFQAEQVWTIEGHTPQAMDRFRDAVEIFQKTWPSEAQTANAIARLALAEDVSGHFADAEPLYRRAVEIFDSAQEAEDPLLQKALEGLGRVLLQLERPKEARPFLERAVAWTDKNGLDPRALYFLLIAASQSRRQSGDTEGADQLESRALELLPKANPGAEGFHV